MRSELPSSTGPEFDLKEWQRDALKDDIKIIAQSACIDAQFAITDDADSFFRFCQTFKKAGKVAFKTIILEGGFDRAVLDYRGQGDFIETISEEGEPGE